MTNKKNVAINIVMNWITFAINILIGLIITPRIISMINAEAYGYVGLANSMTNYITIITVALNSMAGRFISVKLFEDKKEEANKYFATTFYANLFCVGLITICSIPIIFSLDKIIVIPDYLINDVKWLYTFTLANFCISLITTAFSVSTFVTNQLYKSSIIQGMLTLARAFLLAFIYYNNQTKIFYWGLVNLICAVVSLSIYIYILYKKIDTSTTNTGN